MVVLFSQKNEFNQNDSITPLDVSSLDKNNHPCIQSTKVSLLHNIMLSGILRMWLLPFDELLFHKIYDMVFLNIFEVIAIKLILFFI